MPRIRTIKPEFFRSPSTAKASPVARILYQAMWCWADDFGIGETNIYGLLGFAFPDSDEVAVEEIPLLLKEIQSAYEVVFYTNRGRYFYAVTSWDDHQKTERRAAKRRPGPDDQDSVPDLRFTCDEEIPRQPCGTSSETQGKSPLGTGEQGNRGTGNIGNFPVRATEVCHQSAGEVAPPPRCSRHIGDPNPPDCGGCAAARRSREEWQQQKQRNENDELERKRIAKSAAVQAEIDCDLCEGGWLLGADGTPVEPAVKCGHQVAAHA